MMSGKPLETCWAFNKFWNKKFHYKVVSCWLFLLIQTAMHGSMNIKCIRDDQVSVVANQDGTSSVAHQNVVSCAHSAQLVFWELPQFLSSGNHVWPVRWIRLDSLFLGPSSVCYGIICKTCQYSVSSLAPVGGSSSRVWFLQIGLTSLLVCVKRARWSENWEAENCTKNKA
jgi:hypothetical protein